ncbi:unnamed protein product [Polarella glacialis]|uniref:Aminotransferase class V domain-containing protein n=1 Tax=Polarella glacialis TaxID=89957 RepID=A0A813F774_POLGL|nr:unnamed protein product [Polarella glacialis]
MLPLVFVGAYEHHSHELSWRDGLCDCLRIPSTKDHELDMKEFEKLLKEHRAASKNRLFIGSFSDCSNVTGMRSDIKAISKLLRAYGALFFIDHAASDPCTRIDCNPKGNEDCFDGCYVSPHKFLGGEGSSGSLMLRKRLPPTFGGGGTVKFATQDFHAYADNLYERETAGTPGVLQIMQTAMAFEVKDALGPERIEKKEHELREDLFDWLKKTHPKEVFILGNKTAAKRHPIVSFNVIAPHPLHPRFVTILLSDPFGIQTRAGCSCAGPLGQDLFQIRSELMELLVLGITGTQASDEEPGIYSVKPGWCRINMHYTLNKLDVWYFKEALRSKTPCNCFRG